MNGNNVIQKAVQIYKEDYKNLLMAGLIYAALNMLISRMGMSYALSSLASLFSNIVRASSSVFFFCAYRNRHCNFEDMYTLFTNPQDLSRVISINFMIWFITMICSSLLSILGLIGFILVSVLNIGLGFAWYLFAANPDYPIGYYIKGLRYVTASYVIHCVILSAIPAILIVLLSMFVSPLIAQIICFPVNIFVSLAIAGYAGEAMPSDWYYGGTYF